MCIHIYIYKHTYIYIYKPQPFDSLTLTHSSMYLSIYRCAIWLTPRLAPLLVLASSTSLTKGNGRTSSTRGSTRAPQASRPAWRRTSETRAAPSCSLSLTSICFPRWRSCGATTRRWCPWRTSRWCRRSATFWRRFSRRRTWVEPIRRGYLYTTTTTTATYIYTTAIHTSSRRRTWVEPIRRGYLYTTTTTTASCATYINTTTIGAREWDRYPLRCLFCHENMWIHCRYRVHCLSTPLARFG